MEAPPVKTASASASCGEMSAALRRHRRHDKPKRVKRWTAAPSVILVPPTDPFPRRYAARVALRRSSSVACSSHVARSTHSPRSFRSWPFS